MEMVGQLCMEINRLRMEDAPPVFTGRLRKRTTKHAKGLACQVEAIDAAPKASGNS
jgi:hypothetical protein